MKYYLIVGEASGDLHASRLMHEIKKSDTEAEFRFFGGDLMAAEGGTMVRHYKELAYMGFIPVLMHLPTIMRNMSMCKRDIQEWQPSVVILVDYPGFNLNIAKWVHSHTNIPVCYYISPKIWAWKEWRVKSIRRNVDLMLSILPFEVPFYEKHRYRIEYVGNPTADEVAKFRNENNETFDEFCTAENLSAKPIIALLAGSRRQEIKDNLPAMIEACEGLTDDYQLVLAGAPSIDDDYYAPFINGKGVRLIKNSTYRLLAHSTAALVTSGTATLETALFDVPQVVCYKTPVPHLIRLAFNHIIKVKYISLVNLIVNREIVSELLADRFSVQNIRTDLLSLLPGGNRRNTMLSNYQELHNIIDSEGAPIEAAQRIRRLLAQRQDIQDEK
jgi:lipid-A-disaccharide synthase